MQSKIIKTVFFSGHGNYKLKDEFILTKEMESGLSPESPIQNRMKILQFLSEIVLNNRLEEVSSSICLRVIVNFPYLLLMSECFLDSTQWKSFAAILKTYSN